MSSTPQHTSNNRHTQSLPCSAEAVLKNAAKQNSTGSEMRAVASVLQQVQAACKQQDMKLGAKLAAAFK